MQRVVVSVLRRGDVSEVDLEVPTDVGAAELAEQIAHVLGAPAGSAALELRAASLGRTLRPTETLADAGLWDGARLVLARASDPVETSARTGTTLALANAESHLAVLAAPPPVLMLPLEEAVPRSMLPFVVLGVGLLALVGAWLWFIHGQDPAPRPAEPVAGSSTVAATAELPTSVRTPATVAVTTPTSAPPTQSPPVTSDEDTAWRQLLTRLDTVWGADWPASISLLQSFHTQYPTRTSATEKLYAALVEYGRALSEAGASAAAADAFDQAVRLTPQRFEARAELAALASPTPTDIPERTPIPTPTAVPQATLAPPPPAVLVPIPAPPPAQVETPPQPSRPGCDVTNADIACPLADGSRVQDTISVPDGRHFYWFGVPTPGMELHVEVSGQACPCTLFVLSDQVDNATTPLATAYASEAPPTLLDQVVPNPGPYLLELMPAQNGTNDASALYLIVFGLRVPPTPTPVQAAEPPPLPPTATPTPVPVLVPPVAAKPASEAVDRLRGMGLVPQLETADRYSPAGPGTVAVQDPVAGAAVLPGSSVTLFVASGNVVVPAVVGLFEQDAVTRLRDAGLDFDTRHARRPNVAIGHAADVSPAVGEVVPAGSRVILTVSQGT